MALISQCINYTLRKPKARVVENTAAVSNSDLQIHTHTTIIINSKIQHNQSLLP